MATILYVDDESSVGELLERALARNGHRALGARNIAEAMRVLAAESIDLIVSDYGMPGLTGLEFLELLQREGCEIPVILVTGDGDMEHAVAATKAGAIDYIAKPVRPEQLEVAVEQALELVRLRRENDALRREITEFRIGRQIVGESTPMRSILQTISNVAPTLATVLLQGESGTGKELLARAIHDFSDRRQQPFIKLNCAALPDGLIESALFGHERGAFTGAVKRVEGVFERANGGTLLLDDISEMKLEVQARLLRVLEEQEFERVGGTTPIRADVRVIATTSRNLAAEVAAGRFRSELYHRLALVPIVVTPLRERMQDIPVLALQFALRAAAEIGKEISGLSPEAISLLMQYSWPGNVRELKNAVERAVSLSDEPVLQPRHFEAQRDIALKSPPPSPTPPSQARTQFQTPSTLASSATGAGVVLTTLNVDDAERVLIKKALEVTRDNRTRAAELLGISVRTLRNKLNTRRPPESPENS